MVSREATQAIYLHLVTTAMNGSVTSYRECADVMAKNHIPSDFVHLNETFNVLARWLEGKGLPPLTVLVVRESGGGEGTPAGGFWESVGIDPYMPDEYKEVVFDFLVRTCYSYYNGVSVGDTEVSEAVNNEIARLHGCEGSQPAWDLMASVMEATSLIDPATDEPREGTTTKIVSRNGMVFRENVLTTAKLYELINSEAYLAVAPKE